jgi:glycosyltransferase involved in cell wall biosynthesis
MRIALFTETYLPKVDGVVTMLLKTVEYLQARGDELIIFAPQGGPDTLHGVEVVGLPSGQFWLYPELRVALPRGSIRARLEAFRPDVIHAIEPWFLGAGAIYLSQIMNIPLVTSAHTDIPGYARYYKLRFLENFVWFLMHERHRRANLNLATSSVTLNDLRDHGVERLALWERAERQRAGQTAAAVRGQAFSGKRRSASAGSGGSDARCAARDCGRWAGAV